MAQQAILVTYKIKPGRFDELLGKLEAHVARTKAEEAGCVQFDILVPAEPDTIHLHEVYADEAAVALHNKSEGLARYKRETDDLLAARVIVPCVVKD
ncbi:MAG: putative quinol monooxygenase [Alphaproteobacteria bacterium]